MGCGRFWVSDVSGWFPCTRCGLCCKHISGIEALREFDQGDGVCKFYADSVGCQIYQDRPPVCRIDESHAAFFPAWPKHEFYQKNAEVCNQLQEQAGLDSSYRVRFLK